MSEVKVPVGYKQTEVGVIPEDWEVSNIRNVSLVPTQNGLFYEPKRKGKGIPLINVSDMYKAAPIDISLLELFDAIPNELNTFKVNEGDLFFTRSSVVPSGIAFCNIYESSRKDVVFDSHLIRVRPNKELVYPRFLYLNCLSKHARTALIAEAKTATMTTIDQNAINSCPVLLPPKPEQIAIANALTDTDNLIQSLEKLIAKKEAIKTGTMQQLLTGKTRLPEFATHEDGSPKGFKQTELGKIPEDWEVKKVGMLTNCTSGGTPNTSSPLFWGGTNPWMSSGELHLKRVYDVKERITNEGLESSSAKYIPKNSVLIGLAGQGKTRGTVAISKIPLCTNQSIGAILPSKAFSSEYLYYNLDNRYEELRSLSTGDGGRGGLNLKILRDLVFLSPSIKEQTAIATILSDMDAEIKALQDRLEKTKAIKHGMMQQLLTGKVRLV